MTIIKNIRYRSILIYIIISIAFIYGDGKTVNSDLAKVVDSLNTIRKTSPGRALRYARSILDNYRPDKVGPIESKILNTMGEIYLDLNFPTLALSYFIDANEKSMIKGKKPWILINIGNVYYQQEQWIEAKEKYLDAIDAFRKRNSQHPNALSGKTVALSNLGRIEMNLNHYDQALAYFKEALDIKRNSARYQAFQKTRMNPKPTYAGVAAGVANQHSLLSSLYIKWGLFELAAEQCQAIDSLMSFITGKEDVRYDPSVILGKNYSRKCEINTNIGKYLQALTDSRAAIASLDNWPIELVKHYKIESDLYIAQNDLYQALASIDKGLKICDINGMSMQELDLLDKKMNLLMSNNLDRSALDISLVIIAKKEIIEDARVNRSLENLNYISEFHKDREIIGHAKTREKLYFIIIGFFILFFGLAINYYNSKKVQIKQEIKINKQEKQIIESKLKNKEDELIKMSTNIVTKNNLLSSIVKDLEYHMSLIDSKSDRKSLEPFKKRIIEKIDDSADWDQFQIQFSLAYPDFIECLKRNYPKLRSGDVKLCCYLKMNMNTKEIAKITSLSVRAVENKRYRLRKKLDLHTDTSLDSFISSMVNE